MTTPDPRRWLILPVILSATFMASFDFNVVNVAAPSLQEDLHAGQAALELVIGGYAFAYAAGLVTGGRLGDIFGYRTMFLFGMGTFTLASLLCGIAQTPSQLVIARLLQGITAAAMAPQGISLIQAVFDQSERPKALSWLGVMYGLGGVAGQVLGGLLIAGNLFGWAWRPIFLVNVPVGIVALVFAARLLPRTRAEKRPKLDPVGVAGISLALGLALAPLIIGRTEGWPLWAWISLVASVPAMVLTLMYEGRIGRAGGQPLLDLSLFRNRTFSVGLIINVAFMATFSSFMFSTTLLLQSGLGLSAREAGLAFGPFAVLSMLSSIYGRPFIAKYKNKALAFGSGIVGLGMLVLALETQSLGDDLSIGYVMGPLCLVGLGFGFVLPSLIGTVLAGVRPHQMGIASGVLTTTQQFSGATGIAALGAVYFTTLGSGHGLTDYAHASRSVLWITFGLCAVLVALFALLPRLTADRGAAQGAGQAADRPTAKTAAG
ncbi:MFS transporter [Streptomyces sp. NPDC001719]